VPSRSATDRRSFLKSSSTLAAAPFVGTLGALQTRMAMAAGPSALVASPYGPINPVNDLTTGLPLLKLPEGFSYKSYGWTGDMMSDGQPTPGAHDGMGVVRTRRVGRAVEMVLVRNHERGNSSAPIITPTTGYDTVANVPTSGSPTRPGGGTTNLIFRGGDWVSAVASLSGTLTNCAGGVTPWGTWITCEETISNRETGIGGPVGKKHGYNFEVPADPALTVVQPLVAMGRFQHEAVAVDPLSGFVYQTQDSTRLSGFYRYEPTVTTGALGSLAQGGVLKMARLKNQSNQSLMLAPNVGDTYELEWVTIDSPDANPVSVPGGTIPFVTATSTVAGPFLEGFNKGGAQMSRGEGIWYWNRKMYIVDTAAGRSSATGTPGGGDGCVWELDLDTQVITCIFAVPPGVPSVGNNGDNVTVSPRGGILVCEDGGTFTAGGVTFGSRMMGILADSGDTYAFAESNLTAAVIAAAVAQGKAAGSGNQIGNEFCGACFSPDGRVLFVNIQTPGLTFAISGPWANGTL
jgi:uncharacterized protein